MSNEYGAIPLSTANAVGASLKKKMGSLTGFAPVDWAETINKLGNKLPERTVSGAVCSFSDGADDVPMPSVKASITAVQAGSGDPSPSNVRAISGFAECDVVHTGKNLFDPNTAFSAVGTYMYAKAVLPSNANLICSFTDNDTTVDISGLYIGFYDDTYTSGQATSGHFRWLIENGTIKSNLTNKTSSNILCNSLFAYPKKQSTIDTILARYNIQIEVGSTATAYESYAGETIPVSFGGQTIYGGELNLTTGVLTVTHEMQTYDGDENWQTNGSNGVYLTIDSSTTLYSNVALCNIYTCMTAGGSGGLTNYSCRLNANKNNIMVKNPDALTAEDFITALQSQPMVVLLELATPTTIQLTPEDVRSFLGMNNLWANTGDSELTYFAQPSGGITPVFTEEVICDNSSASSTLTFTEDWHDYDLLQFKLTNSSSGIITYITTTPDILDEIFARSSSKVLFNEYCNTQYITYTESSDPLVWTRKSQRSIDVTEVKGLTATNCTVSTEWIYKRQAITTGDVTITAPRYFEDYDEIYVATCDGDSDDTMPCILPVKGGTLAACNHYNDYHGIRLTGNVAVDTYEKGETQYIFAMMGINYEEV